MKSFLLALILACSAAGACPMCKDSIPNKEGDSASLHNSFTASGQHISAGINASVYFMLGGALAVMTMVGVIITRGVRSR